MITAHFHPDLPGHRSPIHAPRAPRLGPILVAMVPFDWVAGSPQRPSRSSPRAIIESRPWLPELGVNLSFRLDGLSLLFALLICFIGSLVLLYSASYLAKDRRLGSFTGILTGFMAAMLGLVLSENLILVFVFWELTSITSFLLVGFDYHRDAARRRTAGPCLSPDSAGWPLAGVILLASLPAALRLPTSLLLILTATACTPPPLFLSSWPPAPRAAIFPSTFGSPMPWKPPHRSPPCSTAATMVKAGVYLAARLTPPWAAPCSGTTRHHLGAVTMLRRRFLATRQLQLKKIPAYLTVSSLAR